MDSQLAVKDSGEKPREGFQTTKVASIATGHFIHDCFPAFLAPILPLLIEKLGLSLAAAGALVSFIRWPGLAQPFMGDLADRTDVRYFVIAAPTVTAIGMSLLGIAPNYATVVVLLLMVGISHAAFHPASAAMVTRASGGTWGKGLSLYQAGGELGRSLGPLYIVAVIQFAGFGWSPLAAIPGVLASLLLYTQVGRAPKAIASKVSGSTLFAVIRKQARPLSMLAGMIFFRQLAVSSFATFLPTYLTESGKDLWFAGFALSVYEIGGVAGAFIGGIVSDHLGRRNVLWASQLVSVPLFWASLALDAPFSFVALALAGFVAISTSPVQLALTQEIMPENRAAASGIVMFLGFEGSIITTIAFGFAADAYGLGPALYGSILLSLLSLFFTFRLPDYREQHRQAVQSP